MSYQTTESDTGVTIVEGHPFNEDDYLGMNPDVRAAVKAGDWQSGLSHFKSYGISEGRLGCSPTRLDDLEGFFDQPVDITKLEAFRAENFPYAGPYPWLDRPDWEEEVEQKLKAGEISEDEAEGCRNWARNGYLILENCISEEMVDRGWNRYVEAVASGKIKLPPSDKKDDQHPGRSLDSHRTVPELCDIMRHPTILRWVKVLMGREPAPYQTLTAHKGTQQPAHSDSIHMTTYPLGYLSAAWVALEDIHPDSGPLIYYPGSHRMPYYFSKDVGIGTDDMEKLGARVYWERYEPFIKKIVEENKLEPKYFLAKKGDVLIWHANLLHGGSPRRDLKHTRKSLVSHYFVKGAINYHDLRATLATASTGTCTVSDKHIAASA